jgi:hypothetical protein
VSVTKNIANANAHHGINSPAVQAAGCGYAVGLWPENWESYRLRNMRPRYLLAVTIAMGILNLTAFNNPKRDRLFVTVLWTEILIVLAGYLVLWFFWKGKNWARNSVLAVSVLSILNLVSLLRPHGNVIVFDSIVSAWAIVGVFLLYWLNLPDVRDWFKTQSQIGNVQAPE